jgi:hypothetical protein
MAAIRKSRVNRLRINGEDNSHFAEALLACAMLHMVASQVIYVIGQMQAHVFFIVNVGILAERSLLVLRIEREIIESVNPLILYVFR